MTNPASLRRFAGVLTLSLGAFLAEAAAQTTAEPTVSSANQPADKDVVQLSPFAVNSSQDQGYGALRSNALTNFSMDLQKMPATAQVFTEDFINDTASTSIETMLATYAGTVGYNPNNSGAALDMVGDRNGSQGLGIRGLQAGLIKRDGFIGMKNSARTSTGNTDNFDIERVELIEGPQSLLYGAVGGGGVVNTVTKRATFGRRRAAVRYTIDNNSDQRASFDLNEGTERFAVRVAGVHGKGATERYNLSNQHDLDGLYATMAYRLTPKITLRVQGEQVNNLAVFNNDQNFDSFLPVGDPRRGQNSRYLALTGQLANVTNVLNGQALDYNNFSSLAGWWQSEKIDNRFLSGVAEMELGAGFSAKLTGMYSETLDQRSNAVNGKNLLAPLTGGNPFNETAYQLTTPGYNEQQDRTKGIQLTLLHDRNFKFWRLEGRSQTAAGVEFSHQGPSFGSSGYDTRYYQADADWVPVIGASTTDYGRIPMPSQYWTVGSGIQLRPLFNPYQKRVTINGVNYVAQHRILYDEARSTEANPPGVIPNNPTTANPNQFAGNWNPGGDTNNRLIYGANVTDWFDGKVTTLVGVSVNTFDTRNFGPTSTGPRFTILPERDYWGYSYGANFEVPRVKGLRAYATMSTAGMSAGTTKDYYGNPLKVPNAKAPQPELGLKWMSAEGRFMATFAWNPTTEVENETQNAGADAFNAVNPAGINGRFNGGDQWINVDRKASSMGLVMTANPTRNWRMRFSATKLDGEITSTVQYAQLYNDQFYTAGGIVTYKDGTPVMVNAANLTNGPKDTPLSLAMINNPASPFYANPDPNSGSIRTAALTSVLTAVDPVRGQAATGQTGLPISAIQYNYTNPNNGVITVVAAGDKNVGINEYSFNFQTNYSFEAGALKGLGVFFDVSHTMKNRAYYTITFPAGTTNTLQGVRSLYRMPDLTVCGLGLNYKLKLPGRLNRFTWETRFNIKNLLDQSEVVIMPNPTNSSQLRARLDAQPRLFIWSNTIAF
jgi:outer membrane receptor protein involved in Fe transport